MIAYDKKLHLAAGFAIGVAVYAVCAYLDLAQEYRIIAAIAAATAIGWAKEYLYDKKDPANHTVDKQDWYYTIGGGVLGAGVAAFALPYFTTQLL